MWDHAPDRDNGCLCASKPELISLREWNLSASDTPALVILDTLVDDGWRAGRPPAAHTLDTPRIFTRPTRMTQVSYWRCLAMLHELCVRGVVEFLSGKPQQYYCNLLAAHSRGDGAVMAAIAQGIVRHRSEQEQSDSSDDDGGHAVALSDVPMAPLAQARHIQSMRATDLCRVLLQCEFVHVRFAPDGV